MIKTRSTYNVYPTVTGLEEYDLNVYIWSGEQANKPTETTYNLTNYNQESLVGTDTIGISHLLKDYVDITPQTLGSTGVYNVERKWVSIDRDSTEDLVEDVFNVGYCWALEGANSDIPTNNILVTNNEFKTSRTSHFIIPVKSIDTNLTIVSYPNNEINFSQTITATTNSIELIKNIIIDLSETTVDEYILFTYNNEEIYIAIKDEYKYTPYDIHFINKEGEQQVLTFFKERKDSIEISKESYERKGVNILNGEHQFKDFNTNSKSSFSVNSDFILESNNDTFKELLLSEYVWVYDNGYIPVNLKTKNLEYKTRVNDRLIKYNIEFEYSFNDILNA